MFFVFGPILYEYMNIYSCFLKNSIKFVESLFQAIKDKQERGFEIGSIVFCANSINL